MESNGRPGIVYRPCGRRTSRSLRSWVGGGGGGENKRELSRRQQHHHSSTFDCIRSKKKKKKRRRKGQSTFSCRHFPYSASSSSRPFSRRLRYIYTRLDSYTFITAFESERIASTTFLLFWESKNKRGEIDRSGLLIIDYSAYINFHSDYSGVVLVF